MDGGGGQADDPEYRKYTEPITLIREVHLDPLGRNSYVELDDGTRLGAIISLSMTHAAGQDPVGHMTFSLLDVKIV